MKKLSLKNKRIHVLLRTLVAAVGTGFLVMLTTFGSHGTVRVDAGGAVSMKISLYKWVQRVSLYHDNYYSKYYTSNDNLRALIMWKDGNEGYYMTGLQWRGHDMVGRNINTDPYIISNFENDFVYLGPDKDPSFMTRTLLDSPTLKYQGEGKYHEIYYKIKFTSGKYLYTDFWDDLEAKSSGDTWNFMNTIDMQWAEVYGHGNNSKIKGRAWYMYYARDAAYDTDLKHNGDHVYGKSSGGGYNGNSFYIFTGKEIQFDAIGDYTLDSGQVLTLDGNVFLLDGKTLNIKKDAVLCIRGNFYCNGTINCEGTIVIDKNANMLPYSPTGAGGNFNLTNGGTMIVSSGARVMLGLPKDTLNSTKDAMFKVNGGQIHNYGELCLGYANFERDAELNNYSGSQIFMGYTVSGNPTKFLTTNSPAIASAAGLKTAGSVVFNTEALNYTFTPQAKNGVINQKTIIDNKSATDPRGIYIHNYEGCRYVKGSMGTSGPINYVYTDADGVTTYSISSP